MYITYMYVCIQLASHAPSPSMELKNKNLHRYMSEVYHIAILDSYLGGTHKLFLLACKLRSKYIIYLLRRPM